MFNFKKAILELADFAKDCDQKRAAYTSAEDALTLAITQLANACRPACLVAVTAYNADHSTKIVPGNIELSFDLKEKLLSVHVKMRYASGHEVDEEYDASDVAHITRELRKHLAPALVKAKIPFKFDELTVPTSYYMK